ncbi:hypothetical protein VTL71DRAFT_2950 [Oculimacula yallundae]|uniref:Uncharacterized protein n=1 Tax=Oculimacula yallundae TaxID=86028 RepID=A0ABR4C7J8_9HELO
MQILLLALTLWTYIYIASAMPMANLEISLPIVSREDKFPALPTTSTAAVPSLLELKGFSSKTIEIRQAKTSTDPMANSPPTAGYPTSNQVSTFGCQNHELTVHTVEILFSVTTNQQFTNTMKLSFSFTLCLFLVVIATHFALSAPLSNVGTSILASRDVYSEEAIIPSSPDMHGSILPRAIPTQYFHLERRMKISKKTNLIVGIVIGILATICGLMCACMSKRKSGSWEPTQIPLQSR